MNDFLCVCGHKRSRHMCYHGFCYDCSRIEDRTWKREHKIINIRKHSFKLDNLQYIENLAKERKLV